MLYHWPMYQPPQHAYTSRAAKVKTLGCFCYILTRLFRYLSVCCLMVTTGVALQPQMWWLFQQTRCLDTKPMFELMHF